MIHYEKALLIFAEGPHDVAFLRQMLKFFFRAEKVDWKFSDYPAPFQQLFRTSVEKHAAKDLSLDMAHKFFLPDRTLVKEDQLVLLFNSGGKDKTEQVKTFLKDFLELQEESSVFRQDAATAIKEARFLFLYDADDQSFESLLAWFQSRFDQIEDTEWKLGQFVRKSDFGAVGNEKAVYMWGDSSEKGTLEDLLLPMFIKRHPDLFKKSGSYVDDAFTWKTAQTDRKRSVSETARRKKAILTVSGQRKKPGGSLNVIIDQAELIRKTDYLSDDRVRAFADFLSAWTGMEMIRG